MGIAEMNDIRRSERRNWDVITGPEGV